MEWLRQLIESALTGKLAEGTEIETLISSFVDKAKKEIGKHFVPKDDFNSKNEELKATKKKMDDLQKQVDDLSKSDSKVEELQEKLKNVTKEFEGYKQDTEKRETDHKKQVAVEAGLRAAKASEDAIDLLTSQFDLDKVTLDNKGNIVDWEDHLKPIKESRKTLFGEVKNSGRPPANPAGGGGKATKEQLIEQYNVAEKEMDVIKMQNFMHQIKQIEKEE